MILLSCIDFIGSYVLTLCTTLGGFLLFFYKVIKTLFTTRLKLQKLLAQMELIGVDSFMITILTGTFAGAVLALQSYTGFKRYGGQEFMGPFIALCMSRELGPVITGLMVTGRAGSAIAAEIGTMQITEEIDALKTLNINPLQYLAVPRILASIIVLPFLTIFSIMCGIIGGYGVGVHVLGLNNQQYIMGIEKHLELADISHGLIKAAVFGLILSWVGAYKGFSTHGGARGVGIATTQSVVMGSILLLGANYVLTALLFD